MSSQQWQHQLLRHDPQLLPSRSKFQQLVLLCQEGSAIYGKLTVLFLHVGTIHALQNPAPMPQTAQSTPRCTVAVERVITLLSPMLVSVVIFAVDHAWTAPRLHAQIKRREAVPEGIIVRARHIVARICELVQ
jgi:hypothetical protein